MATRVTVKGQVTIPKAVREHLGVIPGDSVEFAVTNHGVELRLSHADAKIRAALSDRQRRCFDDGLSTDDYMALIRDEQ